MLRLESFTSADFKRLIKWASDEEMLIQFAGQIFTYPLTEKQLELYVQDADRLAYKVILDQLVIGHAEIYLANAETAVLCRLLIGKEEHRNRGLGLELVNALLTICFSEMKLDTTELNVFEWNSSAIKCYEKAGFSINQQRTRVRKVNELTWVALNMSISKERWKSSYFPSTVSRDKLK